MTHHALYRLSIGLTLTLVASAGHAQTITESLRIDAPLAPTYQPGDFGQAASLGENGVLAVGAPSDSTGSTETGGVYLFDEATGTQLLALKPTTTATSGLCGFSVDIGDGIVAAGSLFESDIVGFTNSVFIFDAATGAQLHRIQSPSGQAFSFFGGAVAVHDGNVMIGAASENNTGTAYVYDTATATLQHTFTAFDAMTNDMFGGAVDLNDDYFVVGSTSQTNGASGGAYVYNASTGAFVTKLSPPAQTTSFGQSVAITDDAIFVGAHTIVSGPMGSTGAVYKYDATTFALVDTFTPTMPFVFRYGVSVSAHDGLLVIGAHEDDNNGNRAGAAFLYNADTGAFLARLEPSVPAADDFFGLSVSTRDGVVAVTKTETPIDPDNGAVYIYRPPYVCGPADLDADGTLTNTDINLFVTLFQAQDPAADLNADGFFTNTDINLFITAFLDGCA